MRPPPSPRRTRPELALTPCHVVVRDYPETLACFRRHGVELALRGGEPVMEGVTGDAGALLDALEDAIAWRWQGGGPAGSSGGEPDTDLRRHG